MLLNAGIEVEIRLISDVYMIGRQHVALYFASILSRDC